MSPSEDSEKQIAMQRVKDVEIFVPIVYGTVAFWLVRKASETQSHRWTVYVCGATNEDLDVLIKRAVFQLHPSFNNPVRVVESPVFELSDCGWVNLKLLSPFSFTVMFHHLKLYAEDSSGPQSTKKPVVVETYNEIVFPEPPADFSARVQNHPAIVVPRLPRTLNLPPVPIEDVHESDRSDTKAHTLRPWFINFSEADELLKLAAARQQVQAHIIKLRRQLSMMDGLPQSFNPASG